MRSEVPPSNGYVDVNFNYNIQSRRIKKGYTQAELSFLMGWSKNQVEGIEEYLIDKDYTISDIARLTEILGCSLKDLFDSGSMLYNRQYLSTRKHRDSYGIIYYEAYYSEGKENRLLFKLVEEPYRASRLSLIKSELEKCVHSLIEQRYFKEAVEAIEIFKKCKEKMTLEFKPRHLQAILKYYIKGGRNALLKRVKEEGRYTYILK